MKDRILKSIIVFSFIVTAVFCLTAIVRIFFFDRFIVDGDSMLPTLRDGDAVYVNKTVMGPRIYTSLDFDKYGLKCIRLQGRRELRPGDIVVFNSPDFENGNRLYFNIDRVLIKRCAGCPGDSISIIDGRYYNSDSAYTGIPDIVQKALSSMKDSTLMEISESYNEACIDRRWSIRNFGPLYIPGQGDTAILDTTSIILYANIIEYETGVTPDMEDIGKKHVFSEDYYFFAGDNLLNSKDSRHFGLIPENFVIGVIRYK